MKAKRKVSRVSYEKLARDIIGHERLYYQQSQPVISDAEYDALLAELRGIEEAHPDWIVPWSPTRRVGAEPLAGFTKVVRKVPMLSLDNTYAEDDVRAFHERVVKNLGGEPSNRAT